MSVRTRVGMVAALGEGPHGAVVVCGPDRAYRGVVLAAGGFAGMYDTVVYEHFRAAVGRAYEAADEKQWRATLIAAEEAAGATRKDAIRASLKYIKPPHSA